MNKTASILLVDDDPEFIESNKEVLEANGYSVLTASTGADGVAVAKKNKPDLMILDVMMATDTEGFDISRDIPKIPELKKMPVIILTGIRKAMNLAYGFEPDDVWLPVKAVLEKPVPPEKLIEAVSKALGK